MLKDKFEAVKQNVTVNAVLTHVKKNKTTYLVGTGTFVAGGIFAYALKTRPQVTTITNAFAPVNNNTPTFNNENNVNFGGYMHKIVKCVETDEIWETAKAAAANRGVDAPTLSRHLNGKIPHVKGEHFEIIGVGTSR